MQIGPRSLQRRPRDWFANYEERADGALNSALFVEVQRSTTCWAEFTSSPEFRAWTGHLGSRHGSVEECWARGESCAVFAVAADVKTERRTSLHAVFSVTVPSNCTQRDVAFRVLPALAKEQEVHFFHIVAVSILSVASLSKA